MKFLLFSLLILTFKESLGCSCVGKPVLSHIAESDFIAIAKIVDVTPYAQNYPFNHVKIKIIDLYKGDDISSLKVNGSGDGSCGIDTPVNSTWLIFAFKHNGGPLSINLCS